MGKTFSDTLSELQQVNLGAGLVKEAQANLIKTQALATKDLVTNFSKKLQEIEGEPLTVEEQLSKLNDDPEANKQFKSLQDQIASYQANTINIQRRQAELNNLYGNAETQLNALGGDLGQKYATGLESQRKNKIDDLEKQRQTQFEVAKYKKFLFDAESARLDAETSQFNLDALKLSKDATQTFADMISDDGFKKLILSFNTDAGTYKFQEGKNPLASFRDDMFKKYGDKPAFQLAWQQLDAYVRKNTRNSRPEWRRYGTGGGLNIQDALTDVKARYNDLKDFTDKIGQIQYGTSIDPATGKIQKDDTYQAQREVWNNALSEVYPEGKLPKNTKFGADINIINAKRPTESGKDEYVLDPETRKLAQYVYGVLYDANSKDNYFKHFNALQKELGVAGWDAYGTDPEKVGKGTIITLPDGSRLNPSSIITQRGEIIYNPYDEDSFKKYSPSNK